MKRADLLRYLRRRGCQQIREGNRHSWWRSAAGEHRAAIPRHREINDLLVRKICRELRVDPPNRT